MNELTSYQGIAFCEYLDPASTSIAVEGLNAMELGDKSLKVVRASIGATQASGLEMGVNAMSMFAGTTSQDLEEGRVLQLLNMVTAEELIDNDDYEGGSCVVRMQQNTKLTQRNRNIRRHSRRMLQVRPNSGNEDSSSVWREQAVRRCGEDLHQIRHAGICWKSSPSSCRQEVCRPHCCLHLFL